MKILFYSVKDFEERYLHTANIYEIIPVFTGDDANIASTAFHNIHCWVHDEKCDNELTDRLHAPTRPITVPV